MECRSPRIARDTVGAGPNGSFRRPSRHLSPSNICSQGLSWILIGWIIIPTALILGALNLQSLLWLVVLAFGAGLMSSLAALLIDEVYGHYNSPKDTSRLIVMALVENLGFRQMTVVWRIRALFGGRSVMQWGNMERRGVANLSG